MVVALTVSLYLYKLRIGPQVKKLAVILPPQTHKDQLQRLTVDSTDFLYSPVAGEGHLFVSEVG